MKQQTIKLSTLHNLQQLLEGYVRVFGQPLEDEDKIPISVEFPRLYVEIPDYILYLQKSFELQIQHICLESLLSQLFPIEFLAQFGLPVLFCIHMLTYNILEWLTSWVDEEWVMVVLGALEDTFDLLLGVCSGLFSRQYLL